MKKMLLALILISCISAASAEVCAVYFTGVGCSHCAKSDPYVLEDYLQNYPELVIIEYEIYQTPSNGQIFSNYNDNYGISLGVPQLVFSEDESIVGDMPIINNAENYFETLAENECLLIQSKKDFGNIDFNSMAGYAKIWKQDRVLIKVNSTSADNTVLKSFIESGTVPSNFQTIEPVSVPISGDQINFENAALVGGWILQWGKSEQGNSGAIPGSPESNYNMTQLTIPKIASLAAVDAVNPCALAVLTFMLVSIISYNPRDKKKIFLAGIAFTVSIFIMYMFYGLVIIKMFQVIQALTSIRLLLYKILGIVAIILGLLQIKDFVKYKPGGLLTEMPMFMRPHAKKLIDGVTSPAGAFGIGLFVTVFLLPCTVGPYIIAGGILSLMETIQTIPWLGLYNLIFVLPMIAITGIVYAGMSNVEDITKWRKDNIRYLHGVAGSIIFILGIAMFFGLV